MRESSSVRLIWSFAPGPGVGGRRPPARLAAGPLRLLLARLDLGPILGLLPLVAFPRPRLDLGLGLGKALQAIRAPGQLLRYRHPVRHIRRVGRLRQRHQFLDLGLQLRFDLSGMLIRQRAVPARIGMHLGAVQRHRAQLHHAGLPGQHQKLHKQTFDLRQKAPPERGDGVMVGMVVGGNEAERHRIVSRPLKSAARKHPRGVAVDQKTQQYARMVRGRAGAAIGLDHRRQVQVLNHFHNEARQMPFRQPLINRGRQKKPRRPINLAKIAHRGHHQGKANQLPIPNLISTFGSSPTGC